MILTYHNKILCLLKDQSGNLDTLLTQSNVLFLWFIYSKYVDILRVSEKLPVSKLGYFGKYIIQLYGYFYVHVSGQGHTGLER